ncbi:MAG: hypothetical protein V4858_17275 [Pseudomonadota bacterium]
MKPAIALILAASAAFFTPAHADAMVAREGKNSVTILGTACPAAVAKRFPDEVKDRLRQAYATIGGKHLKGCWLLISADVVVALLGDELYEIPAGAFKNEFGV